MLVVPGDLDEHAARRAVAGPGDAALAALGAGGVFARDEADVGHELARRGKAQEVLKLGHECDGRDELDAAHGLQCLHDGGEMPCGHGLAQGLFEPVDARGGFGDGMQILLEGDLLGRVRELEGGQPAQILPGALV